MKVAMHLQVQKEALTVKQSFRMKGLLEDRRSNPREKKGRHP